MERREISQAVIARLPRYYRYLGELMEQDVERISSSALSKKMNLTASQIRQDLNNFGGFGQQGYGYNVRNLHDEIARILNIDREHGLIIIGAGHLGQAIANYANFEKRGFMIRGIFDHDPNVIGKSIRGVTVRGMEAIERCVREHQVQIAALCIPKDPAVEITRKLLSYGIVGIWNFAHVDLEVPPGVVIENVHLSESLMRLTYRVGENER